MKGGRWILVGYVLRVAEFHVWCNRNGCDDGKIETDCPRCGGWGAWDDEDGHAHPCKNCWETGVLGDLTECCPCMHLHESWKRHPLRVVDRARIRRLIRSATQCKRPCLGCCFEFPATAGLIGRVS